MNSAQELVASTEKLLCLPSVYQQIRGLLEDPASTSGDLSQAVASDPAIAARVLQVANSALYGSPGQIASIERAVTLMGLQRIHDLVLASMVLGMLAGLQHEALQGFRENAIYRALAARSSARRLGMGDPDRLFVEGLLADIGHLVMYQADPAQLERTSHWAQAHHCALSDAEQTLLGFDFAEVGATLACRWALPRGFAAAIGAQLHPARGGPHAVEAALIHLANALLDSRQEADADTQALARVDPVCAMFLELDPALITSIRQQTEQDLLQTRALLH
jgi:HD-like signal output (HDOD) protein